MSARILIVEDHADLRHLIRMMLEFDGYEIYEASDASEGLEMVHRVRPHLLVLDIMLPGGMNGLDLCRLLKTNPALGLPAVVLGLCCTSRKADEITPAPDAAMPWHPRAPCSGARVA